MKATKRLYELFEPSLPQKTGSGRFGDDANTPTLIDPNVLRQAPPVQLTNLVFNVIAADVNCTKQIFNSLKRVQLLIV